jgi:dipeptidyl aminopeptidase/acylaminoacyl peptidase
MKHLTRLTVYKAFSLIFLAVSCLGSSTLASPLAVTEALNQSEFDPYAGLSVNSDGEWLAFSVEQSRWKKLEQASADRGFIMPGASIRLKNVKTNEDISLGGEKFSAWWGKWSPDGRFLAYYSNETGQVELWVWELATRRAHPLGISAGQLAPQWTPDSKSVIAPVIAAARRPAVASETYYSDDDRRRIFKSNPANPFGGSSGSNVFPRDLALFGVETASIRRLASGFAPVDYAVSRSGKFLAFTAVEPTRSISGKVQYAATSVWIVSLEAPFAAARRLADPDSPGDSPDALCWSPIADSLLLSSVDATSRMSKLTVFSEANDWQPNVVMRGKSPGRVSARWSVDGKAILASGPNTGIRLSATGAGEEELDVPSALKLGPPVSNQGTGWVEGTDSNTLVLPFVNQETKESGFITLDFRQRKWRYLMNVAENIVNRPGYVAWLGQSLVYVASSPAQPQNVWVLRTRPRHAPVRITNLSPQLAIANAQVRLVNWTTPAGLRRRGALLLPADFSPGKPVPVVVYPYPSESRSDDIFKYGATGYGVENMQLFATRGMGVFLPDVDIGSAPNREKQTDVLSDIILSGIDEIVRRGFADPQRLGIMGHSWGGTTVYALLTRTPRFRAAVARAGVADWISDYGRLDGVVPGFSLGAARSEWNFGGTLWQKQDAYLKGSSLFDFDKITTPILIIQGQADTNVSATQSEEAFSALQRLGKDVTLVEYKGEDHVEAFWSYDNQIDYATRIIAWFQDRLTR